MAKITGKPAEHGMGIVKSLQFNRIMLLSAIWLLTLNIVFIIIHKVVVFETLPGAVQNFLYYRFLGLFSIYSVLVLAGVLGFVAADASGMLSKAELIVLAGSIFSIFFVMQKSDKLIYILLTFPVYVYISWRCYVYAKQTEITIAQYRSGINGETNTANELAKLSDDFLVIHGLPFNGGDIDHLVIGPSGIFAIDTKNMRGRIEARGGQLLINDKPSEKNYLAQATREIEAVCESIQVPSGASTEAILVFPRGDVGETIEAGVRIMTLSHLAPYITGKPDSLDESALTAAIYSANSMYDDHKENDKRRNGRRRDPNRFRGIRAVGAVVAVILAIAGTLSGSSNDD